MNRRLTHLPAVRALAVSALLTLLASCTTVTPPDPGIGTPVSWEQLDGWTKDQHAEAWPALLNSCKSKKLRKNAAWQAICTAAAAITAPDNNAAKEFFETWFAPHPVFGSAGKTTGLITGYYEPLLHGSFTATDRYRYPLYQRPASMLQIDLGDRFPELRNKRLRGRVQGSKVIPFYSREQIDGDPGLLQGEELIWLDSRDDAFFLHIQGSGRVKLPDGKVIGAGYSDQNGHIYRSIGKVLVDQGEIELADVTLFSIRQWLRDNPQQAQDLLNQNPSYVFFVLKEDPGTGPTGSLNVPLTAGRSIAIDPKLVNLGPPVWLSTHFPGQPDRPLNRLVFAQDTGGAIKGNVRADLFWGHGENAEQAAGTMKSTGSVMILLPKSQSNQE